VFIAGRKSSATVQQMHQFDYVFFPAGRKPAATDNRPVDAETAELVDQKRQPTTSTVLQQVPDQAGLAGTEKAGNDGSWNL
jgi:hypothetical protein